MKYLSQIALFVFITSSAAFPQVSVNTDSTAPHPSAILDAKSETLGFLPPRMTSMHRDAIPSPAAGLVVFNTDTRTLDLFIGTEWIHLLPANAGWSPGQPFVDLRNNHIYKTVKIRNQCWLAENMDIGVQLTGYNQLQNNGVIEKHCYQDDPANCLIYGGLYTFNEAVQYSSDSIAQGICPEGWHVPSDYEWKVLEGNVDSQYGVGDPWWEMTSWRGFDAGGNLKEADTLHWQSPNAGATNSSGFTALPAGYRSGNGAFLKIGEQTDYWTSTLTNQDEAWRRHLAYDFPYIYRSNSWRTNGVSVRCIKTPAD